MVQQRLKMVLAWAPVAVELTLHAVHPKDEVVDRRSILHSCWLVLQSGMGCLGIWTREAHPCQGRGQQQAPSSVGA